MSLSEEFWENKYKTI